MTIENIIALSIGTLVSKVKSLNFNMLSRFVTVFLPKRKSLLISWLQSSYTVILELRKIKSVIVSISLKFICHDVMRQAIIIFVFMNVEF